MTRALGGVLAAAMALAASTTAPASADPVSCPNVILAGNTVGDPVDAAHRITGASLLSATSSDGKVTPFGYLYVTQGAGAFVEDGMPHGWIVPAAGTTEGNVRAAYATLQKEIPASRLSRGATAMLEAGSTLTITVCAPRS